MRLVNQYDYLKSAMPVLASFRAREGKHFIFYYADPKDSILANDVLNVLEQAREAMGSDLGYSPPDKIRVEAYRSRADFITVSTLTEDEVTRTGTIALCKFNRMLFVSPRAVARGYEWQKTIAHEYVHFIVSRIAGNVIPIWLHEGTARYLESRYLKEEPALSTVEQDLLFRAIKNNTLVSFSRMHPSMAKLKDAEEGATAFAEVFCAIRFVVAKAGYRGLRDIIRGASAGLDLDSLLTHTVGAGTRPFEEVFFEHLRSLGIKPVEGASITSKEFTEDNRPDEAVLFRKHVRLAELLLGQNRAQAAVKELERADSTGKTRSPWIMNQIGQLWERNGEPANALKAYERSIFLFPEYCNGYFNSALLREKQGDAATAAALLRKTLEINPYHVPAREALVSLTRDKAEAERQKAILRVIQGE